MVQVALLVAAGAGLVVWIAGAKFSRFVMTLLTVLIGAAVGMQLPRWLGWNISGAGTAVGGAVVLGVSGFVLHGMWGGVLLGSMLAVWATFVTWICVRAGQPMIWPPIDPATTNITSWSRELWAGLPENMHRILPFAAGAGMVTGLACAILWTRLTTIIAWSLTGVTLLVTAGLASIHFSKPEWLGHIPPPIWQGVVLVGATLLGVLVQGVIFGVRKRKPVKATPADPKDEFDPRKE
jgi:hypothetical protein